MNLQEINKAVAEKVMGWNDVWQPFFPTTEIADAWIVVEKFFRVEIETGTGANEHLVTIRDTAGWTIAYSYGKTVPLAICLAALKAVGVEVE